MAENSEGKRDFTKFNGVNFPQWKFAVMLKLKQKKLDGIVLGYDRKPNEVCQEMEVERVNVTVITNQNEIDTWIDKDISAQGIIFYNIEPSFQVALEGSGSSNEMWNRLILQYAQVAIANADFLLGKFQLYKMDPDHSVMAHINRLKMMADELNSIECHISEQALIVRILQTLPPSFRHFLSVWDSVPSAERNLVNLTARLVTEELRSKSLNNGQADPVDVAFFASHPNRVQKEAVANAAHSKDPKRDYNPRNNNSNYRDNRQNYRDDYRGQSSRHRDNRPNQRNYRENHRGGKSGNRDRGCFICGRTNHKAINCWERKNDERREARGNKFDRNRDSKHDDNNNDNSKESFAALSSVCFLARKPSYWYADTGASHHMTNQRSYFTSFEEISDSWTVNGIGGVQVKALGVGTVPIVSYINGESKAGTLHEVLFVPDLGTNLFSVGIATDHGIEAHFAKDGATS